jgi:hypothetical protein
VLIRVGDVAGAQRLRRAFDELPEVPATTAARRRLEAELSLSRGAAASALESFQRGFAGVRRTESRWPMVRGLLAAGDVDGAIRLLTRIVEHPIVIYARPEPHAPGLLRQAATVLVQLVARRDAKTADTLRRKYAPFVRSTRSTSSTASPRVH